MPNDTTERDAIMKIRTLVRALRLALAIPTFGVGIAHAGALALPDTPLNVSASVPPNVMLLIDNSGSMENIIWHDEFDPGENYGAWRYRNGSGGYSSLNADSTYYPSSFAQGSCSDGFDRFRLGASVPYTYKCLKLPAPNGAGDTGSSGAPDIAPGAPTDGG